ncbi:EAL domain-containing response regulator [Psychrosphaera sp. B3R10]|uniref:EAL domain-containing response regulator n=1 Tax=unclassified Psychrosphaera TaxID=2641570 RepID=UPI001C0A1E85|nr:MULTISPECIES: EAL domain-containing response regulator [unclassified Psychrosphaera]MBU2883614.1 EAL domain-containing response regulator [Psychrosphaera sp. I2R16]MBU2989792.1 EAL domain-containing response regulator [Psychrosphaera sp. B3R10]
MIDKFILVVDDDPLLRKILARMLKDLGQHKVLIAIDGFAAMDLVTKHGNDIGFILSDLKMPGMDGVEFFRHLAELETQIPLAIMTGTDSRLVESIVELTIRRGLNYKGTLTKPVSQYALASLLQTQITVTTVSEKATVTNISRNAVSEITVAMLGKAIIRDEIECYLQPQIDAKTLDVIGFEALARWHHPELGLIMPDRFITVAENNFLIDELTFQIFRKGLESFRKIKSKLDYATISFNLSSNSLNNTELPEILSDLLYENKIQFSEVVIEITESKLSLDFVNSLDVMTRLSLKGFNLSIDDFGTGFSSLEQLQKFPFTELKIDRVFTQNLDISPTSQLLVESSVRLAQKMGLKVVAEGVETEQQISQLRTMGCDILQGFYFSKALDSKQIEIWLNNRKNTTSLDISQTLST